MLEGFLAVIGIGTACGMAKKKKATIGTKQNWGLTPDQNLERIADLHKLTGKQREWWLEEMGHSQYRKK